jgi:hypothetical protein
MPDPKERAVPLGRLGRIPRMAALEARLERARLDIDYAALERPLLGDPP